MALDRAEILRCSCLSYWFPRVQEFLDARGQGLVLVPPTRIIRLPEGMSLGLPDSSDSKQSEQALDWLLAQLDDAAQQLGGYPCFLRTGLLSGKHRWHKTCHVECKEDLPSHVYALVEESACADILGLPYDVWVVRGLLHPTVEFHSHGGMPVCREFRAFGRDGRFECMHPYWPADAIRDPDVPDWQKKLARISRTPDQFERKQLIKTTEKVTEVLGGYWSVDFLRLSGWRWMLIDMAVGEQSWHWPSCPHAKKQENKT